MAHKHGMLGEAQLRLAKLREEARARSAAMLEEAKDRGGELIDEAQGRGERAWRDAKRWIVENPAEAVGLSFVAGVIAASFFRRRED